MTRRRRCWACITMLFIGITAASAQDPPSDIQKMIDSGMAEALEARFPTPRDADALHIIAQAYTTRGGQAETPASRDRAYAQATHFYERWLTRLEAEHGRTDLAARVMLAAARIEYAGVLLAGAAVPLIDEYELTAGARVEEERLRALLHKADALYEQAGRTLGPIVQSLAECEDDLLAAGLYDRVQTAHLDRKLNQGWARYYLGVLTTNDDAKRHRLLSDAQGAFQELVNSSWIGPMRGRCYLALAIAHRALRQFDLSEQSFRRALAADDSPALDARARVELARAQVMQSKFDEAHTTLRPLLKHDLDALPAKLADARFYVNLAHLWDANADLLAARSIRKSIRNAAERDILERQATQRFGLGLQKFRTLERRGGPWPELVQSYVSRHVDLATPPADVSPLEALYAARVLMNKQQYAAAREHLNAAKEHDRASADLAGDILFESGRCAYQLRDLPAAAEVFAQLAQEQPEHARAPEAITLAYRLYGQIAEQTKRPEHYRRLASILRILVEHFADHPDHATARWLLPRALELAGEYDAAAAQYAKLPLNAEHGPEARYRELVCRQRALKARRAALSDEAYTRTTRELVTALTEYAHAEEPPDAASSERRLAARLAAAELLSQLPAPDHRAALRVLADAPITDVDRTLVGRVLALRIQAHRGLRQYDTATRMLRQFLESAPADQVGPTLAELAHSMEVEVERLLDNEDVTAARALARDALETFAALEKWVRADATRKDTLEYVRFGRAKMCYWAEQYDNAARIAGELTKAHPENGLYKHLLARALTAQLDGQALQIEEQRAAAVWRELLGDSDLRKRAPEHYWEARYNWLAIQLRLGNADDVVRAIEQESIWHPAMGGPEWKPKFEQLLETARLATRNPG